MPDNSILVLGSSNTDMIIKVDRIPKAGETILGGEFVSAAGGKGANQAVAAARAGGTVTFIARVGTDVFGEKAVAGFVAEGINVDHVFRDPASPSGVASFSSPRTARTASPSLRERMPNCSRLTCRRPEMRFAPPPSCSSNWKLLWKLSKRRRNWPPKMAHG